MCLSLLSLLLTGISCTTVKYYPSNFVESLKHPTKFPDVFDFTVQNIEEIVEKNPLQEDEEVKFTDVGENKNSSMHLFQVRKNAEIASHYHKRHDEVIYVKKGSGIAILDGTRYMVKPGSILQIPSKTVHKFVNTGDETFMAVSIFSPPFDGRDQKFIQKQKRTDRGVKEERRLAGVKARKAEEEDELGSSEDAEEETIKEATQEIAKVEERIKKKSALSSSDERDFQIRKEGISPNYSPTSKEGVENKSKKTASAEPHNVDIVSLHEQLTKLLELKEEGTLSADEYEKKKDALIMGGEQETLPESTYSMKRNLPRKEEAILKEVDKYVQLSEDVYRGNDQYTLPNPLDHYNNNEGYQERELYEQPADEFEQEDYEAASEIETLPMDHKLRLLHEMRLEGLISEEDFQSKKRELALKTEENSFAVAPANATNEEKLSELKELYEEGLITEEDYRHKYDELSTKEEVPLFDFEENTHNEKVRELEELYKEGLITEDDYNHKYKELTDQKIYSYDVMDKVVNNEKLSELHELMEQGIITKEDYEFKKAQLIGN